MSKTLDPVIGQCKKFSAEIRQYHPYVWSIDGGTILTLMSLFVLPLDPATSPEQTNLQANR